MDDGTRISRRATLAKFGGLLAGAVVVGGLKAADSFSATDEETSSTGPAGVASGAVTCVLAPEQTEGPYIWHCDAGGVYSGTSVQGTENDTFLRGIQRADAKGIAVFRTVYPGWYQGRTVHIHIKVSLGGNVVHTGQLYFPDTLTDTVYKRTPYNRRPNRNPRNAGDSIYRNGGKRSTLKLVKSGSGYVASITMGIQRS